MSINITNAFDVIEELRSLWVRELQPEHIAVLCLDEVPRGLGSTASFLWLVVTRCPGEEPVGHVVDPDLGYLHSTEDKPPKVPEGFQEAFWTEWRRLYSSGEDPDGDVVSCEHHGEVVWGREGQLGQHRRYCLCRDCGRFCPEDPEENCDIAAAFFRLCVLTGCTAPIFSCPEWKEISNE